ncbi:hypothetical protein NKR19_g9323 [Coniochaeta hoffmannii]|uniref:Uncharacterized protein n=1 Tax=Coniochaeta hoffmannii TaxID=91930 RepID=A0AA38R1K4_9PEZI|nr:hypothetical protein NKR19_g9323 [Coniochaeta hoffmannii]
MGVCHEISHTFSSFLSMTHGSQHRLREPSKTFYSAYSGLRPNEDCPKIPFPENRGEVGKAFEYLSWGGVSKVSPVDGADDDENAKIDAAFLGALHIIRTNVDGDYKRRVLPGELAECFFKAPEDILLTNFLFMTDFQITELQGPLTYLLDGDREADDSDEPAEDKGDDTTDEPADDKTVGADKSADDAEVEAIKLDTAAYNMNKRFKDVIRNIPTWTIRDAEAIYAFCNDPRKLIPPPQ